jgi:hypothetical protein
VNLIVTERALERRHSALAVRNDLSEFRIRFVLHNRRSKVGNVHALSNRGASSVWTVAHGTFRPERSSGRRFVRTRIGPQTRDREEQQDAHNHWQNGRGVGYGVSMVVA